jgi:hypothetical protein
VTLFRPRSVRSSKLRPVTDLAVNPIPKFKMSNPWLDCHHRSGWPFTLSYLNAFHHANGYILDDFIEKKFAWGTDPGDKYNNFKPYSEPWIGIWHNPPNIPEWYNLNGHCPSDILQSDEWRSSQDTCLGIITFSDYLKRYLETKTFIPIYCLYHPTEFSQTKFDYERFLTNEHKRILHIGWWLRKFHTFFDLDAPNYEKCLLKLDLDYFTDILNIEKKFVIKPESLSSVKEITYLNNSEYDFALSQNLVYLDLYDSSANNVIIECIERNTPILINPLEPVLEYLKDDYPFYFSSDDEARDKLNDLKLIKHTSNYLRSLSSSNKFTPLTFVNSLSESSFYKSLPAPQPVVSIICSCYRADGDLVQFINDIKSQTIFSSCEIFMDNFETSHQNPQAIMEILNNFSKECPNVTVIHKTSDNLLYETWNDQIRIAKSEYICMACIDDRRSPIYLERMISHLKSNKNIDVATCTVYGTKKPFQQWNDFDYFRKYNDGFNWQENNKSSLGDENIFSFNDLFYQGESAEGIQSDCLPHCMPVWRKDLHSKFGFFDELTYGSQADWEFWLRCAENGVLFYLDREPLGLYFENPSSHNRRNFQEYHKTIIIEKYHTNGK